MAGYSAAKLTTCLSLIIFSCLCVRWSVSINSYSGAEKPTMYGDYEAQRHWMEVTFNLPISEWYQNSSDNDLQYWGLDYPPLTAYHSWLCGYVADKIDPDWVALHTSRGYESGTHKLFMRYTVMLVDLIIYLPAILLFYLCTIKNKAMGEKLYLASAVLSYPGLILIDHGHFQYNNASLGLTTLAVSAICLGRDLWGSFFFVCALNYKQMELYHSIPFFCYLLGSCFKSVQENGLWKLIKIGIVVVLTFDLCWLPFLRDKDIALQVLQRLFPFGRGLFEDKVSNVWCLLDVLFKLKRNIPQHHLVLLSLATTLICLLPSALNLLVKPTVLKFKYALVNCSLVFFLFSYQVHEKSILIPALSVCLVFHNQPFLASWFLLISTFSMFPLLVKDELVLPYVALTFLFLMVVLLYTKMFEHPSTNTYVQLLGILSVCGSISISMISLIIPPPPRYPDIYPVLISGYSCVHFLLFLVYFHYAQFSCTSESEPKIQAVIKVTTKKPKSQQRKKKTKKVD